jgi:hypothetical protein
MITQQCVTEPGPEASPFPQNHPSGKIQTWKFIRKIAVRSTAFMVKLFVVASNSFFIPLSRNRRLTLETAKPDIVSTVGF